MDGMSYFIIIFDSILFDLDFGLLFGERGAFLLSRAGAVCTGSKICQTLFFSGCGVPKPCLLQHF